MKCCVCNNSKSGEFITINNKKYHLCCIEELQEENQELKKQLEHYKTQEIERIDKNLLDAKNNYLERCIKANMVGGNNE